MLIAIAKNARCEECVCVCIYFYMLLGSMDLCIGKCPCMPWRARAYRAYLLGVDQTKYGSKHIGSGVCGRCPLKILIHNIVLRACNQKTLKMGARMSGSDRLQVHIRKPADLSYAGSTGGFVRVVFAWFRGGHAQRMFLVPHLFRECDNNSPPFKLFSGP